MHARVQVALTSHESLCLASAGDETDLAIGASLAPGASSSSSLPDESRHTASRDRSDSPGGEEGARRGDPAR